MILLNIFQCDILKPATNFNPEYYQNFLSHYTLTTVSAIVSQRTLMPDTYENMTAEVMNSEIDNLINGIVEEALHMRHAYRDHCLGAGLESAKTVQETESRTFLSEFFSEKSKEIGIQNREMVIRTLNASAFINYFFLIEDTLKKLYFSSVNLENPDAHIGGAQTITRCLKKSINAKKLMQPFMKHLTDRSRFFISFKSLEDVWELLNFIRNRLSHYNGYFDQKAKERLNTLIEKITKNYIDKDEYLLSINTFNDALEEIEEQIEKTGFVIVNDTLENIIRNTSVFIMESFYLSERENQSTASLENTSGKGIAE